MLCEIDSLPALPPQNLLDLGPRYTGCMPIHHSEALTVLCLFFCLLALVVLELYCL